MSGSLFHLSPRRRYACLCALGLCVAAAIYAYKLDYGSLAMWDEALTGERSREFLINAPWYTPFFDGVPAFDKPPLYYWLTAATIRLAGPGEASVRCWSAIFGFACIVMMYVLGRRLGRDRLAGWIAAALLAFNADWINWTRQAYLDSGAIFGMLAGAWFLLRDPFSMRSAWLSGAAVAAGSLTKGPFASAIYVFSLAHAAAAPSQRRRRLRVTCAAIGVSILLTVPWYALQICLWGEDYFQRFFVFNIFQRVTQTIEGHKLRPVGYLFAWRDEAPFSLYALIAGVLLVFIARRSARRRALLPGLMFLFFGGYLFAMASRRTTYMVYAYPWAALTAGLLWAGILRRIAWRPAIHALLAAALAVAVWSFHHHYNPWMDFSPEWKRIAKEFNDEDSAGSALIVVDAPVNALMYYSRPGWQRQTIVATPAAIGDALKSGFRSCFTVVRRDFVPYIKGVDGALYEHHVIVRKGGFALIRSERREK